LDRWWTDKQAANRQAGGPPAASPDLDSEARVNLREIAERLGIAHSTIRRYPALYARGKNPFPAAGEDGRRRWGDVLAWHGRRYGSGPRAGRRPQHGDDNPLAVLLQDVGGTPKDQL
jgi:hypothetical protein